MKTAQKLCLIALAVAILPACSTWEWTSERSYLTDGNYSLSNPYPWDLSTTPYDPRPRGIYRHIPTQPGYHFTDASNPTSHKSRDKGWIHKQAPGHYTIMMGEGKSPAEVAKLLHKSPKKNRAAQYKFHHGGNKASSGVWGSYNSPEAAQRAMSSLPEHVRKSAKVKKWGYVQQQAQKSGRSTMPSRPVPLTNDAAPSHTPIDAPKVKLQYDE